MHYDTDTCTHNNMYFFFLFILFTAYMQMTHKVAI